MSKILAQKCLPSKLLALLERNRDLSAIRSSSCLVWALGVVLSGVKNVGAMSVDIGGGDTGLGVMVYLISANRQDERYNSAITLSPPCEESIVRAPPSCWNGFGVDRSIFGGCCGGLSFFVFAWAGPLAEWAFHLGSNLTYKIHITLWSMNNRRWFVFELISEVGGQSSG